MVTTAPYGSWRSPIGVADLTTGSVGLNAVRVDGDELYWLESRPDQGGRVSLWRRAYAGGDPVELTPGSTNVRTRVNEYGGGEYGVSGGVVVYSDLADGRLRRLDPDGSVTVLTGEGPCWYGDPEVALDRGIVVAVREDRRPAAVEEHGEAVTTLVAIPLDGSAADDVDAVTVLASGADFYSTPQVSADGRLAWTQWDHPNMPWDSTAIHVAPLQLDDAATYVLDTIETVAGGPGESAVQPRWRGLDLVFVSDRNGWWNLYLFDGSAVRALHEVDAEMAEAQWVLGMSPYAVLADGDLICQVITDGLPDLALLDVETGDLTSVADPGVGADSLAAGASGVAAVLTAPDRSAVLATLGPDGSWATLRSSTREALDPETVSIARDVTWLGEGGVVHGWYYAPISSDFVAPDGDRPPLITLSHGGPTSQARAAFTLATQFWTTRGYAVLDVNYGGSSGYGRAYRERLQGRWGLVDVADCSAGALAMVDQGLADPRRLVVKGGSAGGYTTLRALTATDVFTAGISSYGIGDLEILARDTHKFESRYLDGLVGPYPADRATYVERSPLHHVDELSAPILLLQGLEDQVVPPNQAETFADAARAKGLPVALLLFEGEGHGFRRAETIVASYEAQLSFLGQVFGFTPADDVPTLPIDNLG